MFPIIEIYLWFLIVGVIISSYIVKDSQIHLYWSDAGRYTSGIG